MSVIGIVSEYNPFHFGHLHHIDMSRQMAGGESGVIAVMSGDFVQRGDAAVYSKFARAEAACLCGADLVVELPLPWCLAGAESFARGAVSLLAALGADTLSFGSECGDIKALSSVAEALSDEDISSIIMNIIKARPELPYVRARQLALEERIGEVAKLLSSPNNILAVEYLKALRQLNAPLKAMTVKRIGSGHDEKGEEGPRSASELREFIYSTRPLDGHIPESALSVYRREREQGRELSDRSYMETAILSRLRMLPFEHFMELPDGEEGLCRRIYSAIREEGSLSAVFDSAKTKRYAHSRIRRLCFSAALGLDKGLCSGLPPYARVLAANERGRELLRRAAAREELPIITRAAGIRHFSQNCQRVFELGADAHDLYMLSFGPKCTTTCGQDWRTGPKIV